MTDRPLTEKQLAFAEGVASGLNPYQASKAAGYVGSGNQTKMLADERMRDALKAAALKAGLSVDKIGQKLYTLANAQRFELSRDGTPVHLGDDSRSQLQAIDIAIKMLGGYPNPRLDVNLGTQNVLLIDSAKSPLAALDPFGTSVEAESVREIPASYNPDGGILPEDDFQIG